MAARLQRSGGIPPARLKRVLDAVEERLGDLSLSAMAAEAALSPFHFARAFKASTGRPPWAYVIERRIARAVSLLGDPDVPFAEIARATGFASASHLGASLRSRLRLTPAEIRRMASTTPPATAP